MKMNRKGKKEGRLLQLDCWRGLNRNPNRLIIFFFSFFFCSISKAPSRPTDHLDWSICLPSLDWNLLSGLKNALSRSWLIFKRSESRVGVRVGVLAVLNGWSIEAPHKQNKNKWAQVKTFARSDSSSQYDETKTKVQKTKRWVVCHQSRPLPTADFWASERTNGRLLCYPSFSGSRIHISVFVFLVISILARFSFKNSTFLYK